MPFSGWEGLGGGGGGGKMGRRDSIEFISNGLNGCDVAFFFGMLWDALGCFGDSLGFFGSSMRMGGFTGTVQQ